MTCLWFRKAPPRTSPCAVTSFKVHFSPDPLFPKARIHTHTHPLSLTRTRAHAAHRRVGVDRSLPRPLWDLLRVALWIFLLL